MYKPKHIFQNFGKPTEIPNHFYNASFLFHTYKRLLYGTLTLQLM